MPKVQKPQNFRASGEDGPCKRLTSHNFFCSIICARATQGVAQHTTSACPLHLKIRGGRHENRATAHKPVAPRQCQRWCHPHHQQRRPGACGPARTPFHQPHHSMASRQSGVPQVEQRQGTQGIKLFTACAQFHSSEKKLSSKGTKHTEAEPAVDPPASPAAASWSLRPCIHTRRRNGLITVSPALCWMLA